ncbi:MAG: type II toxin-antitoxin system HicB family antitoxin [Dysgonamonadaceae bacterium]|jgi:predicted RNase H-like HicB family nuclease|nr:type II toxin-antitoxin system HicB family antitoxin [Dysgonamonadaceae bacterium]
MVATALIEKGKDGTFGIFTSDINSTIIGEGNTVAEAKADFENSVREIIRFYEEDGRLLPDELKDVQFVYKYDIASVSKNVRHKSGKNSTAAKQRAATVLVS